MYVGNSIHDGGKSEDIKDISDFSNSRGRYKRYRMSAKKGTTDNMYIFSICLVSESWSKYPTLRMFSQRAGGAVCGRGN